MLGNHEMVSFNRIDDPIFEWMFNLIQDRIIDLFEQYTQLENMFDSIQIVFIELDQNVEQNNTNNLKGLISKHSYNLIKKDLNFFGNNFKNDIGKPLDVIKENNRIVNVPLEIDGKLSNFLAKRQILWKSVKIILEKKKYT